MMMDLGLVLFLIIAADASMILITQPHSRKIISTPMAQLCSGPANFSLNTSSVMAPLVILKRSMSYYCETRKKDVDLDGKTILIDGSLQIGFITNCPMETAYINLAQTGPAAIIIYLEGSLFEPGLLAYSRGPSYSDVLLASKSQVPMVSDAFV